MKKNDIVSIRITDSSVEGSGVGHYEGMAVFVPMTAVGDELLIRIVKCKKNYAFGITEQIIKPSENRINVDCPSFKQCGGCVYRHIDYKAELELKQKRVYEAMKRIGGIDMAPKPIVNAGKRGRYRNKAQYPISVDGSVGLYAARSHRIVSCSDCLLQPVEFSAAAAVLGKWIRANNVTVYDEGRKTGLVRHLCLRKAEATGELMAVLVINGNSIPKRGDLISGLLDVFGDNLGSIQLNINTDDTNVIMGKKCITIYGKSFITDKICGIDVRISALSFYQVNREMAERLYKKAAEYACPENRTVLDLYCGIGTIGLTMAKKAQKIIGVELIEEAVADARVNAEQNGIYNAEFICADASEAVKNFNENGLKPDTIIVDPPRKGCYEQVIEIMASGFSPERIVYISCDPATLARDTAMLADRGYKLSEYTPFDLFPGTAHIETAALFIKKDDGNTAE